MLFHRETVGDIERLMHKCKYVKMGCYGRILARGDGERGVGIVMLSQK